MPANKKDKNWMNRKLAALLTTSAQFSKATTENEYYQIKNFKYKLTTKFKTSWDTVKYRCVKNNYIDQLHYY